MACACVHAILIHAYKQWKLVIFSPETIHAYYYVRFVIPLCAVTFVVSTEDIRETAYIAGYICLQ